MIIAVASGKGGTGKTTVAVNLAICLNEPVHLLDCDVEEPNCHIFLEPEISCRERVSLPFPVVDEKVCNGCGECSRVCQYNAIVALKTKPLVFPSLCHGCGGCVKVCPVNAISEGMREIGTIETGRGRHVQFVQGCLDVGQSLSPPLIRAVKRYSAGKGITIIDCPPGTSCPVIAAVKGSDYVVLVTEPTPFGLHDLKLAVETMRRLELDFGVVINRAVPLDQHVVKYCKSEHIPILLEIPDDRRAAVAYSRGQLIAVMIPEWRELFERLCWRVIFEIQQKGKHHKAGRENMAGIA
jgi:MinD superfamily P-loop ATPase